MKLWPNLDNEGLDAVLEVPIPEEMYTKMGSNEILRWQNMHNFMKARSSLESSSSLLANSDNEFLTLLKIVGAPLIPFRVDSENYTRSSSIKNCSIDPRNRKTAKYITRQYVAACGRHSALNSIRNMYAVGKVQMQGSEMPLGDDMVHYRCSSQAVTVRLLGTSHLHNPVMHIEALLDPYDDSHRCTLDCSSKMNCSYHMLAMTLFILWIPQRLDPRHSRLKVHLNMFEDKKLVRMKTAISNDSVFWETSVESMVQDYQHVDGINIAHSGKTITTLYRYEKSQKHKRRVEEI
ncbi:Sugar transporter, putative isoform 1 [Hibiscus syriacus]|uniref:Sugar transporter, putative isoform 1 n=1 Tax=Hibiscus syriacus TaxID=106335 RepID=A0A6A3BHM0_HIBSY|nr:Sugar transporter, putative isoform 1 [Hibiscus syriacus]